MQGIKHQAAQIRTTGPPSTTEGLHSNTSAEIVQAIAERSKGVYLICKEIIHHYPGTKQREEKKEQQTYIFASPSHSSCKNSN
jgi:hypothetical protein